MRSCKQCEYTGEVESFPLAGVVKGVTYYRHVCGVCYTAQKLVRKHKIRESLNLIKKEFVCVRCGNNDWRVIDWHHDDPLEKDFTLGDASRLGISMERIQKELKKCTPLCANCHRIVEYEIRYNISG